MVVLCSAALEVLLGSFYSVVTPMIVKAEGNYIFESHPTFSTFLHDPCGMCFTGFYSPGNYGLVAHSFMQYSSHKIHDRIPVNLLLISSTSK